MNENEITQIAEAWFKQAIDEVGKDGYFGTCAKEPAKTLTKEDFDAMIAKYFPEPPKAYKVNEVMFSMYFPEPPKAYKVNEVMFSMYRYGLLKAPVVSPFIGACTC